MNSTCSTGSARLVGTVIGLALCYLLDSISLRMSGDVRRVLQFLQRYLTLRPGLRSVPDNKTILSLWQGETGNEVSSLPEENYRSSVTSS
jgi:hypothetical protein